jgi:hypothetical protein
LACTAADDVDMLRYEDHRDPAATPNASAFISAIEGMNNLFFSL